MLSRNLPVLFFAALLAACQPPAEETPAFTDADAAAIEAAVAANVQAFLAEDTAALAAMYTSDAVSYGPNETMTNPDSIAAAFTEGDNLTFTTQTDRVSGSGDLAYWTGTYRGEFLPPNATDTVTSRGNWVLIYRRDDAGAWKMAVEIWNSPIPAPAAAE